MNRWTSDTNPTPYCFSDYNDYWRIVTEAVRAQQQYDIVNRNRFDSRLPRLDYCLAKRTVFTDFAKAALSKGRSQLIFDAQDALEGTMRVTEGMVLPDRTDADSSTESAIRENHWEEGSSDAGTVEALERLLKIL
jgi:hypothetical protein